jgi:hypothetical protein
MENHQVGVSYQDEHLEARSGKRSISLNIQDTFYQMGLFYIE